MKNSSTKVRLPAWQQQLSSRLKEGALIALTALCLYLWMALLTYDPSDPGWSHSSSVAQVQNAAGRAGAWFADVLFMALGYFAYLFPLLMVIKTAQAFAARHEPWPWSGWLLSWRLTGLAILIPAGSALAYIHFHSASGLPASAGGALGEVLGKLALDALNVQGSTLMFLALFLFGLTVFADLSWFRVMDLTGKITLDLLELVQGGIGRWWSALAERRRLVARLREAERPVTSRKVDERRSEPQGELSRVVSPRLAEPPTAVLAEPAKPAPHRRGTAADIPARFQRPPESAVPRKPRIEPVAETPKPRIEPELVTPRPRRIEPESAAVRPQIHKEPEEVSTWSGDFSEFNDLSPSFQDRAASEEELPARPVVEPERRAAPVAPLSESLAMGSRLHARPHIHKEPEEVSTWSGDFGEFDDLSSSLQDHAAPEEELPARPVVEPERRAAPVITPLSESLAMEPKPHPVPMPAMRERPTSFVDSTLEGTLPPLSLLDAPEKKSQNYSPESLEMLSRLLEIKLKEFGVEVIVESVHPGPVITRFEIQPAPGVKVSRISNLAKDLARSMAMISVRVVEVIPGRTTVGIEVPNEDRQIVRFSEVLSSVEYEEAKSPVTMALGHDIGGKPVIADLAKMPHLLVAGTTGSGKSVGVNAMILSILFKSTPEEARLIMIDPKMLELSIYEGIPHLLCPVVTDMKEAANALRWSVAEMERRYKLMAAMGVRNLAGFNRKVKDAEEAGTPLYDPLYRRESMDDEPPLLAPLPTIVVVVDEFADMMMIVGKKVEELIARIAQKARAAGIHLILATQRPSVDVITGLIKANIPTRMAFQVSSKIDSRTILDQGGAEQLLGHGDMLYLPPGTGLPIRVHGAFVSDDEVHRVVEAWKQRGAPDYVEDILAGAEEGGSGFEGGGGDGGEGSEEDPLYDEAVRFVTESRRASISAVQRKLKIGYNRAARMIEAMEMAGVVSSMNTNGSREVIAPAPVRD
ncbi:DNA translocase FtsK [Azotobacter beijerinckii]|uniref:DNA translocase FtsK n=2 Tax=Gammaproteobacteria TaxID=1236 RepID=A0A1I3ZF61_9GAMM|nr:DNA translocase FtsK 4TM domain-containing protein [Azotobacter beijerinckii]SFB15338.1 DNA segregation ATPase FtsK/SpoIIIE, S-DNA-T family [Azotobacter beijerinckii]SFK42371.1 DNA segregation ATPase FtsK/SpoIIIE, S-DNA-T family [Azotobacter beijerinckii]